jgi:hypothetical protein
MTPGRGRRSVDSDSATTRSPTAKAIAIPHRTSEHRRRQHLPQRPRPVPPRDTGLGALAPDPTSAAKDASAGPRGPAPRTLAARLVDVPTRFFDRTHVLGAAKSPGRQSQFGAATVDCGGSPAAPKVGSAADRRHREATSLLHGFQGPSPEPVNLPSPRYQGGQRGKPVATTVCQSLLLKGGRLSGASRARSAPGRSPCPSAPRSGVPVTRGLRRHC